MSDWVPFFREVTERVLTYETKQKELTDLLHEMKVKGLPTTMLEDKQVDNTFNPLEVIDPFTFLVHLAQHQPSEANRWCVALKKKWHLQMQAPIVFPGLVSIFSPNVQSWFFTSTRLGRTQNDIPLLWQLARQAYSEKATDINQSLWDKCLKIRGLDADKLSIGLFLLSPNEFLPLRALPHFLESRGININSNALYKGNLNEYRQLIEKAREINSNHVELNEMAYQWADEDLKEKLDESKKVKSALTSPIPMPSTPKTLPKAPLNQILYGPPGTGKTFNAIPRAVEIITGEIIDERLECQERFDELRRDGRIGFVTFHQSFTYEEFIEGLRPKIDTEADTVSYEVRDGILKQIALKAIGASLKNAHPGSATFEDVWQAFLTQFEAKPDKIYEGLTSAGNFHLKFDTKGILRCVTKGVQDPYPCRKEAMEKLWFEYRDRESINTKDIDSILRSGWSTLAGVFKELKRLEAQLNSQSGYLTFDALWQKLLDEMKADAGRIYRGNIKSGTLTGGYSLQVTPQNELKCLPAKGKELPYSFSKRTAEEIWKKLRDHPNMSVSEMSMAAVTNYSVWDFIFTRLKGIEEKLNTRPVAPTPVDNSKTAAESYLKSSPDYRADFESAPRYVLIVDEINRGNISRIFGELITLLEDDKRLGATNELRVTLPVSQDTFALPPNLYIVGTMNTADKSLALLDIALRRRFEFEEIRPNFDLPALKLDTAMRDVLKILNNRLEATLDREHCLGHAYFMGVQHEKDFNTVFRNKIIPLLQEFFYNDWETLRAVLGEGGDKSGHFIRKLPALSGLKNRTGWRWWFDVKRDEPFNCLEALRANYAKLSEKPVHSDDSEEIREIE